MEKEQARATVVIAGVPVDRYLYGLTRSVWDTCRAMQGDDI